MNKMFIEFNNDKKQNTIIIPGYLQKIDSYISIIEIVKEYSNILFFNIFEDGFNAKLSLNEYAELLHNKIKDLENVVLIGHSFGGRVIFSYSTMFKHKHKLILIDVAGIKYQSFKTKFKIIKFKILKNIIKNKEKLFNKLSSEEYKSLNKQQRKTFQEIINTDYTYILNHLEQETLIIWGQNDTTTPLKIGKKMSKNIKNSGFVVIPNAAHYPHIENYIYFKEIMKCYYEYLKEGVLSK